MRRHFRAIKRQLRLVLPHTYTLSSLVVIYLISDMVLVFGRVPLRWGWLPTENFVACLLACVGAFCYGAYRVFYFHPLFQLEYARWLQRSAWTVDQRLPNGPVSLVWQDLLLVGLLILAAMRSSQFDPLYVCLAFALPYLLALALALFFTDEGGVAFVLVMGLGGFARTIEWPYFAGAFLVGSYVVAAWGLRRSLKRLHEWDFDSWEQKGLFELNESRLERARQKRLGWPFEKLSLKKHDSPITTRLGLAIAVIAGWAAHIGLYYKGGAGPGRLDWNYWFLLGLLSFPLALGRVIVYYNGYVPPVNIWVRLLTFRWIIPRYDQMLGPSLLIFLVWTFGSTILSRAGVPVIYGVPPLIALNVALALTMPPSLETWHLTGGHRIMPQAQNQTNEMIQTP